MTDKSLNKKMILILISLLTLFLFIGMSIVFGYTDTSLKVAYESFTHFDGSTAHIVIQSIRVPRALIAAAVGACLAMAGVIMQTLTKNPLASPSIFGINSGASFFVVIAIVLFQLSGLQTIAWFAFGGAALAAIGVFSVSSIGKGGMSPIKLTLAGAAISAMFASFTQGLLVLNESALDQVLFWLAGSVQGRKLELLASVFPYMIIGWIGALILAPKLNVISMGEDVAKGLGLKTGLVKLAGMVIVVLLAGAAVAVAGPIGFIGIVVPHIARKLIGIDHRWLLPFSAVLGAVLLLAADITARYVIMPQEVPVGVMTAAIGAPFFIYLARKGSSTNE
jgi:iron complex transport system permease protein